MSKEEAERVLAIRNELQLMDHQIERKIADKDKEIKQRAASYGYRGRGRPNQDGGDSQEQGRLRSVALSADQLNESIASYK